MNNLITLLTAFFLFGFNGNVLSTEKDSIFKTLEKKMHFDKGQIEQLKYDLFQPSDFEKDKSLSSRPYLQSITLSSGYSASSERSNQYLKIYSDTSRNTMSINKSSPVLTFSHDIALGNIFSLSYSLGYQQMDIDFNRSKYSSFKVFFFINPRLVLFNKKRLSGYSKLNIGVVYEDAKVEMLSSSAMTYFMPPHYKIYTGFTPIGLSLKLSNQLSLNSELSLWSFESINIGLKYSFRKNPHYTPL